MITLTNTCAGPWAVMVVHGDTTVAHATVERAWRLKDVACGALLADDLLLRLLSDSALIAA